MLLSFALLLSGCVDPLDWDSLAPLQPGNDHDLGFEVAVPFEVPIEAWDPVLATRHPPALAAPDLRISPWQGELRACRPFRAGDTDGDGHQDLVIGWYGDGSTPPLGDGVAWHRGGASGPEPVAAAFLPHADPGVMPTWFNALGDMDGDGLDDVVAAPGWWFMPDRFLWLVPGSPVFGAGLQALAWPAPGYWTFVNPAVADVIGDGRPDLLALDLSSYLTGPSVATLEIHQGGQPVVPRSPTSAFLVDRTCSPNPQDARR